MGGESVKTGTRIKELRIAAGLTQEELGEKIGVKKAAVHKWESGITQNLKRSTIQQLANLFDVSPAYIMGMRDNPEPEQKFDPELEAYLEHLRTRPEMRMLFKLTKNATKEEVMQAVAIIEALHKSTKRG